jgi:hypothetical protein
MSVFTEVGNLMHIYLDEITPGYGTTQPDFLIQASANLLNDRGGRNWVPVIVRKTDKNRYELIGNAFVYAIAEAAGLERVWCIVADDSDETAEMTKILAGEAVPKINLSIATRDEIKAALEYLVEQPKSILKSVKLAIALNRIEEAPRKFWKTLDPITTLKCGITKGAKLDALKQVFYLTPQPLPEVTSDPQILAMLTTDELKKMAKKRNIPKYTKLKKPELIELLSQA